MRTGRRIGILVGMATVVVLTTPSLARAALSITVPPSANLGSVPSGTGSFSQALGTVTVAASGLVLPSFVATVSSTSFTPGGGGSAIPNSSISYWSGPATATSGAQTPVPGQASAALAVNLSSTRTAFSSSGLVLSISTSWNPTIVVTIPAAAVAGTYTGTITHSVA